VNKPSVGRPSTADSQCSIRRRRGRARSRRSSSPPRPRPAGSWPGPIDSRSAPPLQALVCSGAPREDDGVPSPQHHSMYAAWRTHQDNDREGRDHRPSASMLGLPARVHLHGWRATILCQQELHAAETVPCLEAPERCPDRRHDRSDRHSCPRNRTFGFRSASLRWLWRLNRRSAPSVSPLLAAWRCGPACLPRPRRRFRWAR
jgi:hypothetical protein